MFVSVSKSKGLDPVKHCIPGFNATSQENKPFDKNLSPFISSNSKPIQYGDTSVASTSTDNPEWSPGDCLMPSNYEGRFKRTQSIINSPVPFDILDIIVINLNFRIQLEQEKLRSEKELLKRRQGLTSEGKKFKKRRKGTNLKKKRNQIYFPVKL